MDHGWKAIVVTVTHDRIYKFRVHGWNRHTGELFSWSVPNLDYGFDLEGALFREAPAPPLDWAGTEGYAGGMWGAIADVSEVP